MPAAGNYSDRVVPSDLGRAQCLQTYWLAFCGSFKSLGILEYSVGRNYSLVVFRTELRRGPLGGKVHVVDAEALAIAIDRVIALYKGNRFG